MSEQTPEFPNEILVPVYVESEIVYMTPPEYYSWLGRIGISE